MLSETPSLFSARLNPDNPVRITADVDFGNDNPSFTKFGIGRIVTQLITQRYAIAWPRIRGAQFYRLYGSVSPTRKKNLLQDNLQESHTHFVPPVFVPTIVFYFWAAVVLDDGTEHYLDDEPATLETTVHRTAFDPNPITESEVIPDADGINDEMPEIFEYIRAGNRFELENDGEPALLFSRRHGEDRPFGIPCTCSNQINPGRDPDYRARGRCGLCYGTGIAGGFYPSVPIRIRYSGEVGQNYTRTKTGFVIESTFNTFMLWAPQVRTEDLIIRVTDGTRYRVSKRMETSARAIRLHQAFDLEQIPQEDICLDVTDEQIRANLETMKLPGFVMDGFKSFG